MLLTIMCLEGCQASDQARREQAGALLVTRMACGSCHEIPGIEEADGTVGPPLTHFASQQMIAGVLPNTPGNLARFLRSPRAVVKVGVMPDQPLNEEQARDVVAYLHTLD